MTSLKTAAPALAAALLFGASTPLAKLLGLNIGPQLLAGLLYLGSGAGLGLLMLARWLGRRARVDGAERLRIPMQDLPWLAGAILAGGVCGPALLMAGLAVTDAASASLLLNLEGVLTAVVAWWVFKEHASRSIILGMVVIVGGGVLLSLQPGSFDLSTGALFIVAACACWAIDNNLTRQVSANDALLLAGLKGVVAGAVNTGLALAAGAVLPDMLRVVPILVVGFAGYGLSLALFVVALRRLGTARTGAYFAVAPLLGVLVSLALWPTVPGWTFWAAAGLMSLGVWLHVRERHEHEHTHEPMGHSHPHRHDEHHRHAHDLEWDGSEPHMHAHQHVALTHRHVHFPDLHHLHRHPH
jgi:drug/metabolite transporter (DMT)-like permease